MVEFIGDYLYIFYWFTAALLLIATSIIIVFGIIGMVKNTQNAKKTILTSGGLVIVLSLAYFGFASDEVFETYKPGINSETSQLVGMGLWSFYILLSIAIASIVIMGGLKMMNKK